MTKSQIFSCLPRPKAFHHMTAILLILSVFPFSRLNSLTPKSDYHVTSPENVNTVPNKQLMRILKFTRQLLF